MPPFYAEPDMALSR